MLIEFDTNDFLNSLHEAIDEQKKILTVNMEKASKEVLDLARDKAPYDTGHMEEDSAIQVVNEDDFITGWIGFFAYYAIYVHQGTGLFALNGDGRQTPWWWYGGETGKWAGFHYTHGQKPKQFLLDSLIENRTKIPEILGENL